MTAYANTHRKMATESLLTFANGFILLAASHDLQANTLDQFYETNAQLIIDEIKQFIKAVRLPLLKYKVFSGWVQIRLALGDICGQVYEVKDWNLF